MTRSVFRWRRLGVRSATDTFTRADDTDFDGSTTETGDYTWTNLAGDSGTIGVKSNQCYASDNSNAPAAVATIDFGTANVEISVVLSSISSGAAGISFRVNTVANFWYVRLTSGGTLSVHKTASGVTTQTHSTTVTFTPGDVLTVRCSGSDITVLHNASVEFSFSDSHQSTQTKHGVAFFGTINDNARIDDFSIVEI